MTRKYVPSVSNTSTTSCIVAKSARSSRSLSASERCAPADAVTSRARDSFVNESSCVRSVITCSRCANSSCISRSARSARASRSSRWPASTTISHAALGCVLASAARAPMRVVCSTVRSSSAVKGVDRALTRVSVTAVSGLAMRPAVQFAMSTAAIHASNATNAPSARSSR